MLCCTTQTSVNALSMGAITGYLSKIKAHGGQGTEVEEERRQCGEEYFFLPKQEKKGSGYWTEESSQGKED